MFPVCWKINWLGWLIVIFLVLVLSKFCAKFWWYKNITSSIKCWKLIFIQLNNGSDEKLITVGIIFILEIKLKKYLTFPCYKWWPRLCWKRRAVILYPGSYKGPPVLVTSSPARLQSIYYNLEPSIAILYILLTRQSKGNSLLFSLKTRPSIGQHRQEEPAGQFVSISIFSPLQTLFHANIDWQS